MGHCSGPFCRSWVAAVVHCSCIACCGSNCAMFLQCSTEALATSPARVGSAKNSQDSEWCWGAAADGEKGFGQLLWAVSGLPFFFFFLPSAGSKAVFALSHYLVSLFGQESLCGKLGHCWCNIPLARLVWSGVSVSLWRCHPSWRGQPLLGHSLALVPEARPLGAEPQGCCLGKRQSPVPFGVSWWGDLAGRAGGAAAVLLWAVSAAV